VQGSGGGSSDSRKVAMTSLFQNCEEQLDLGSSEIGQYSCAKLLREMEVVDSEADEEKAVMDLEDVEMVCLPDNICVEISKQKWVKELPKDIYTLPDMNQVSANQLMGEESSKTVHDGFQTKSKKGNWGPVLAEKRPTRVQRNGRTVLEKAHDRKKKTNLEEPKGITYNSFSLLSAQELSDIARDTDIGLGKDMESEMQSVLDLVEKVGLG
jgi:hypothetical protein